MASAVICSQSKNEVVEIVVHFELARYSTVSTIRLGMDSNKLSNCVVSHCDCEGIQMVKWSCTCLVLKLMVVPPVTRSTV